jgi:GWxTD domain-containing protein
MLRCECGPRLPGIAVALMILVVPVCAVLFGCAGPSTELANAGKSLVMPSGMMSFEIECLPVLMEHGAAVDVYWGIPPSSLSFERTDIGFRARYEVTIRLSDNESNAVQQEQTWAETTLVATYTQTQRVDPLNGKRRLAATPGIHGIEVVMEDRSTGVTSRRIQLVTIPNTDDRRPCISRMFLESRLAPNVFAPFVFFHVPSGLDSLRAAVDCFRLPNGLPCRLRWRFDRFPTDSVTPSPPYAYVSEYALWPTRFREVQFENSEIVQSETTFVSVQGGVCHGSFALAPVSPGLYRVMMQVDLPGVSATGTDTTITASRVISIKGITFPRPSTLDELTDELVYIATADEMKHIRSGRNMKEKRERFDIFWLARTDDRISAAALLKSYYTRIEEANRYFTAANEGWKTDRGMLYIILGPPAEIGNALDTQTWVYNFPGGAEVNSYSFRRLSLEGEGVALQEYRLIRQPAYEPLWTRMVSRWRHGQVI